MHLPVTMTGVFTQAAPALVPATTAPEMYLLLIAARAGDSSRPLL